MKSCWAERVKQLTQLFVQITMGSLSNNFLMSPYDSSAPEVRSSHSSLHFFWRGLQDPTVAKIFFRFLSGSRTLTDWSPLNVYKTEAMLEKGAEGAWNGVITAELKAVNDRQLTSEVVSATAPLDDDKPRLTG